MDDVVKDLHLAAQRKLARQAVAYAQHLRSDKEHSYLLDGLRYAFKGLRSKRGAQRVGVRILSSIGC